MAEEIKADLIVWAAGVRTSTVTQQFDGLELNRINQLVVKIPFKLRWMTVFSRLVTVQH